MTNMTARPLFGNLTHASFINGKLRTRNGEVESGNEYTVVTRMTILKWRTMCTIEKEKDLEGGLRSSRSTANSMDGK